MSIVHTSRIRIEKHKGPHRTAHIENFETPVDFGIHGGIRDFYQNKYGKTFSGPEYPATLDYMVAGIAGWLTGTLAGALEARGIPAEENLVAQTEGVIEDIDGVIRITEIRLAYRFKIPPGTRDKAQRALDHYADKCPAYTSVKGCIQCTWTADMEET